MMKKRRTTAVGDVSSSSSSSSSKNDDVNKLDDRTTCCSSDDIISYNQLPTSSTSASSSCNNSVGSSDDDDDDENEGWMLLLGGDISTDSMSSTTNWTTLTTITMNDENENESENIHLHENHTTTNNDNNTCCRGKSTMTTSDKITPTTNNTATTTPSVTTYDINDGNKYISYHQEKAIFKRAFQLLPPTATTATTNYNNDNRSSGCQIVKPPVRILNNDNDSRNKGNTKGNILIATKYIPKGEIIFTEKAFLGAQIPSSSSFLQGGGERRGEDFGERGSSLCHHASLSSLYKVRACQNCFKSLEPASCLSKDLPLSELWSVVEYDDYDGDNDIDTDTDIDGVPLYSVIEINLECNTRNQQQQRTNYENENDADHTTMMSKTMILHNKSRRVTCQECITTFCNRYCAQSYLQTMGSCCRYTRVIRGLVNHMIIVTNHNNDHHHDHDDSDLIHKNNDDNEVEEKEEHTTSTSAASVVVAVADIDPVIILAARMFVAQVQFYRTNKSSSNNNTGDCDDDNINKTSSVLSLSLFGNLCGEANDIQSLSLGDDDDGGGGVSSSSSSIIDEKKEFVVPPLQQIYEIIANIIDLTQTERRNNNDNDNDNLLLSSCSLQQFYKILAIAQKNSISVTTQSPFRMYYQEMIRKCGGRGTDRQQQIVTKIATILGSHNGKLTRNMDRIVEEKCAVNMGGIFTLTAMMNHSCIPNAEIRGAEYIDCNIDIVATQDIVKGEELTISYLNLGSQIDQTSNSRIARKRRQKELRSRYLFFCQCTRCVF